MKQSSGLELIESEIDTQFSISTLTGIGFHADAFAIIAY